MTDPVRAPWTSEQVDALNRFQQAGRMHPFTCGGEHTPGSPVLVAREDGWHCPQPYGEPCDYQQDWAHAFMLRPEATQPLRAEMTVTQGLAGTPDVPIPETETVRGGRRLAASSAPADQNLRDRIDNAVHSQLAARLGEGAWTHVRADITDAVLAVLPSPVDRAAVLREAADAVSPHGCPCRSRLHNMTAERQQVRGCASCEAGIEHDEHCPTPESHNWGCGCPGDRLPLHAESGVDTPGCDCGHEGMGAKWHAKDCVWLARTTSRCTCGDAGDCFVPAGHYQDCPKAGEEA